MVRFVALFSALAPALSSDELLDSAGLLQARKATKRHDKSEGMEAIEQDCTGQDMWLWLGTQYQKATDDNKKLWIKQTSAQFSTASTVSYVKTRGKTCNQWCKSVGKVCVRGMDDAHHQLDYLVKKDLGYCSIWPSGHKRRRQDEAGCNQQWFTQTCACGEETPLNMNKQCYTDPETDATILHRSCNIASANPSDPFDVVQELDLLVKDDDGTSGMSVSSNEDGNLVVGNADGDKPLHLELSEPLGRTTSTNEDFALKVLPMLSPGQTVTVNPDGLQNKDAFGVSDNQALVISDQPPAEPLRFDILPSLTINGAGSDVVLVISATTNIVADCGAKYFHLYDNMKVWYQSGVRLWRQVDMTLDGCYEACAGDARCKYFSFDAKEGDRWYGCCMGGTVNKFHPMIAQRHEHFTFYEVCSRAEVTGQCDQHHEHSCKAGVTNGNEQQIIRTSENVSSAQACQRECEAEADCHLFAYNADDKQCEICREHHVFQGHGGKGTSWTVMGKDCSKTEVDAKFGPEE